MKWNKKAQLLQAINIDLDKRDMVMGSNGKRKYWNILFGVPNTNKEFLVIIHKGKIDQTKDITIKGTSPNPEKEFVRLEDIHYDSPELLKKALKRGEIYPGKEWAKGYNFMLRKDTEKNITFRRFMNSFSYVQPHSINQNGRVLFLNPFMSYIFPQFG